jgi:hypothetical protein
MKNLFLFMILGFFVSCGEQVKAPDPNEPPPTSDKEQIENLKKQIFYLEGTVTNINNMVLSDFATCANSGNTADALINRICKVSQAATVEAKVAMKSELQTFSTVLNDKINYINKDIASILNNLDGVNITTLQSDVTTLQGNVTTLQTNMTNAQNAITALQNLTASISGALNGTVTEVAVGSENFSAGPSYESLLKRVDGSTVSGYVEAFGSTVAMPSNPVSTTNGSPTLTFTSTAAHSLAIGDVISVTNLIGDKGWAASEINSELIVATVPTATTITVTMPRNATKTGTFGGAAGSLRKVLNRGLGRIWVLADGSDAAVRVANPRGKSYNFIIKVSGGAGYVCYDQTNRSALFATIDAATTFPGLTGNVRCK